MDASIADYVEKTYTPEMQAVLKKGFDLFDRLNLETAEGFVLNILNDIENADTEFVSTNVLGVVEGTIIQLEKSFGFELMPYGDMTLEQRIDFVRGYVDLEDFLDHDAVIRICETDMTDAEKLAEAVGLVADMGVETLMSLILNVDEAALMTLSRIHQSAVPNEERAEEIELPAVSDEQMTQVKAYELFMKEFHLTVDCYQMIRIGFPIGAPFQLYWQQYKDVILTADRATLAKEIIGLFLLSKEHWTNPILAFTNISEELFDTVNVISECNIEVRKLMGSFVKFKAENKIK